MFYRFDHFGTAGAFGLPIAMLAIDIILRVLMIEKRSAIVESPRQTEASIISEAGEESPLLGSRAHSCAPSLAFRHFFDTRLMIAILVEVTISSIFSAFEAVGKISSPSRVELTTQNQTLPLFTIETYQWAPTNAGLVFLGLTLPSFFSIPLAKYTRNRGWDRRKIVATELIFSSLPMAGLKWAEGNTLQHQILFISLVSFVGLFMTTSQAQTMAEVSDSVRQIEAKHGVDSTKSSGMGTGFAFCNMAIAMGQFIGPLIAGATKSELGWSAMTLILGTFSCGVGLFSLIVNY
jgi:MFS family permease